MTSLWTGRSSSPLSYFDIFRAKHALLPKKTLLGYGGRAFSQKRWSDLCCDFEKEEEKNNFSSKIRENILKP